MPLENARPGPKDRATTAAQGRPIGLKALRHLAFFQATADAEDASKAGLDVLQQQIENADPLTPEEITRAIVCDNSGAIDISAIVSRIMTMPGSQRKENARW